MMVKVADKENGRNKAKSAVVVGAGIVGACVARELARYVHAATALTISICYYLFFCWHSHNDNESTHVSCRVNTQEEEEASYDIFNPRRRGCKVTVVEKGQAPGSQVCVRQKELLFPANMSRFHNFHPTIHDP